MYIENALFEDLIRCHRQIADLLEESISDKQRIENFQVRLTQKEEEIKKLQKKVPAE